MKHSALRPAFKLLPLALAMVYAQQTMAQAQPAADDTQVVEVTAQKRKEKIKDVPLAITAISGSALEDRGMEGPAALSGVIPNLQMSQAPVSSLIASIGMRGITSGQPSIWADPSVGLYVDGVFVGKNMGALFDVIDIARVEALRGPQGTLFGRNTEAGAINFVTRKPTGVFGGNLGLELGSRSKQVGRLSMDLPKMGILSASIGARSEKQDGSISNPNGEAWGSKDRQAGRVALRLEPTKDLTIDYAYDQSKIDETPPAGSLTSSRGYGSLYPLTTQIGGTNYAFQNAGCLAFNPPGTCVFPTPGIGPAMRNTGAESASYPTSVSGSTQYGPQYQRLDLTGHSLTAEYRLSPSTTLRYIGSTRDMAYSDHADYDGTALLIFEGLRTTDYSSQSHELQLIGGSAGLRYVAGAYLFKDDGTSLQRQAGGLLTFHPQVPGYQMANFNVGTDAKALYGQVDMDVGAWAFGLGGRHTSETKTVRSWRYKTNSTFVQGTNPTTLDVSGEQTFTQFTPNLNVLYRLNKDTNLFGRIAKGFKSGGFPAEAPVTATAGPNKAFNPETSTSFELGVKGSFMGGKGQYSATVFTTDVKDYQISLLPAGSTSPTIINAGKLKNQGFELDASVAPADGTRVTIGYGYLDAKFKEYLALSPTNVPVDSASNTVVSGAPRHTLGVSLEQRLMRTGSGVTLRGLVDYRYVSDRYSYPGQISATAANATVGNSAAESLRPALGLLDLRLIASGIKLFGPGDAEVAVFVKNATNEHKTVAHMDVSGFYQVSAWNDPRTYGVTLNYKW
jgi:iron complex outermembrane receptor protein